MNLPEIARKAISSLFEGTDFELDEATKKKYSSKQACFVTLTKNKQLRGCIGSLEARKELWRDVQDNAINAAFRDPRFQPLKKEELSAIRIEVSVLSIPKKLEFESEKDLLEKLNNKRGIILKKGTASATFLPQVWEEIKGKRSFLEQLSKKASLDKDAWKKSEIWYYSVSVEKED